MNLASKIYEHLHPLGVDERHAIPLWVRRYDSLVRIVSLGRVGKFHGGTLALIGFKAEEALLDIGCGTGDLVLLAEANVKGDGTFVGLDVEAGMVAQAERKAAHVNSAATFAEAGIDSIPYADQSFDVVTSSLMFHHLTTEQQDDGLIELHRVLKPSGKVIIVDINPARRSLVASLPGHRSQEQDSTAQDRVSRQLRQAGFDVASAGVHPLRAFFYIIGVKA